MSELDDWLNDLFADEPKKKPEPVPEPELPQEQKLPEPKGEEFTFEEIVEGIVLDESDPNVESEAEAHWVERQAAKEASNAIPEVDLSGIEAAKKELDAILEVEAEKRAVLEEKREALANLKKLLKAAENAVFKAQDEFNDAVYGKRDAERKLSEEEHRAEEARKEAEVLAQRTQKFEVFKREIDELNPAWRNAAFDHQWEGATTLALHGSALLADGMGLGKTLESIMYLDFVKAHRTLVITPNDTCENYTLECMMWAPHRFTFTLGEADKMQREILLRTVFHRRKNEGKDFILTVNYEQLYNWDFVEELRKLEFDTVIIDEAHVFKNKSSKLFRALDYLRYHNGSSVERILPMTGTFILNKPQEIWPALYLVDRDAFPEERQFLDAYCTQDWEYKWHFRSGGVSSLIKRLGGRIVMRTMEEAGIKLPPKTIHDETLVHRESCDFCGVEFPLAFVDNEYADQRKVMKQLAEHSQVILDAQRKSNPIQQLALITRNRQAIVWPAGITLKGTLEDGSEYVFSVGDEVQESIKVDWVESKIHRLLAEGKRIVVFSQFTDGIAELQDRLTDAGVMSVKYDGSTPQTIKSQVKRDFDRRHVDKNNGEYKWDVALCNFKTGGVGLNFTHATDIIMLDEEWNPGKNEQAYARCHRMGQTEEVNIWIPRVKATIDMWMKNLNDQKRNLIDGFNLEVDLSKDFGGFLDEMRGML